MNNTVTFSQLITRLAKVAGTDTNTSRLYLRSFFALIEETLSKGEDVTIDGIGTFRRHSTDDAFAPESGISFIPDKTLADEINAPFAVFEPVELADGVDFSGLDTPAPAPAEETVPEPEPSHSHAPEVTPEAAPAPEPVRAPEPVIIREEEEIREEEAPEEDIRQEEVTVTPVPAAAPVSAPQPRRPQWPEEAEKEPEETTSEADSEAEEADGEYYEDEESARPKTLRWVIYGALGVIAVAAVAYFAAVVVQPIPTFGDDEEVAATADTIATVVEEIEVGEASATAAASAQTETQPETAARQTEAAAQPATDAAAAPAPTAKKQEVYDTIKPGYFMAQMARKHYGKAPFWVYIYEANTDVIRNPNRLSNGTRLRIPDKSTFPGATDAEKLKLAIEKQTQLNKKFD